MSTAVDVPIRRRHPLGLPAGSVRALLAFMVFIIIWAMLLMPEETGKDIRIPLYLYYLMFLILGSYFAARSQAPTPPGVRVHHPLFLPRGSLRFLMIAGFAAAMGWGYYHNPESFEKRLLPAVSLEDVTLPLVLLSGFFLGVVVGRLANTFLADPLTGLPAWFQDILAWISLIAVLCLVAEFLIHLVINPHVTPERQVNLPHWEGFLAALVSFYFGIRS
jgi:hypothetical protein